MTLYWVNTSGGNWYDNTNWATTSGGSTHPAVPPTTTDSVVFDRSATYTVTVTAGSECLDITVTAGAVTFSGGAINLSLIHI